MPPDLDRRELQPKRKALQKLNPRPTSRGTFWDRSMMNREFWDSELGFGQFCACARKAKHANERAARNRSRLEDRQSRGVAQPGSAPALGAGGRWFESSRPDHFSPFRLQRDCNGARPTPTPSVSSVSIRRSWWMCYAASIRVTANSKRLHDALPQLAESPRKLTAAGSFDRLAPDSRPHAGNALDIATGLEHFVQSRADLDFRRPRAPLSREAAVGSRRRCAFPPRCQSNRVRRVVVPPTPFR